CSSGDAARSVGGLSATGVPGGGSAPLDPAPRAPGAKRSRDRAAGFLRAFSKERPRWGWRRAAKAARRAATRAPTRGARPPRPVPRSHDGVAACGLAEPLGAELRRPLERVEVHVDQAEPVAEAVPPLEVVLR